jgi:cobalamin synthase
VEIFDFVVFVAAISYIILKRYTEGQWAAIPLIWLAGMSVAAVLLLMAETKAQERQKKSQ